MLTPARLAAHDVTVRFGGLVALDSVSIDVQPGEIVGLVGPNGAGKSTLFAVLSGLLRPVTGSVTMGDVDVTTQSPQKRSALGMCRTFQHTELFQALTVREHVLLANRMLHTPRRAWTDVITMGGFRRSSTSERDRVDGVLTMLGIEDLADRGVLGLPLGQARLVEIARAVARGPEVILLDEASSGLDAGETAEFADVVRRLVEVQGISIILVEHDVELVLGLCHRVFVLDFGRVIAVGRPEEIRANEVVRAAYLGEDRQELDDEFNSERDELA
jgi:branched-chain amino acid transport system ATP-binding protein